jgi:hypothetical protein
MNFLERQKNTKWEKLKPIRRHMILMYIYRIKTDLENIEDYIETYRFREYGASLDDVPIIIKSKTPEEIRATAYSIIGVVLP